MHIFSFRKLLLVICFYLPLVSEAKPESFPVNRKDSVVLSSGDEFRKLFREDSLWSFHSKKGFVPMFFHNLGSQAISPLRMHKKDLIFLAGAAGITLSLYYFDEDIDRFFRPLPDENQWLGTGSSFMTELGSYYGYGFLALSGVYSLVAKNHKLLHTSVMATQAALSAAVWVGAGKLFAGRMRPGETLNEETYDSKKWMGPFAIFDKSLDDNDGNAEYDAFPSGHSAAAFSIATVFAGRYKDRPLVPIIAYSLATTVGITRVIEHRHWASDVMAGALIGYGCGRQVLHYYRKVFPQYKDTDYQRKKRNSTSLSLAPMTNVLGIHCRIVF